MRPCFKWFLLIVLFLICCSRCDSWYVPGYVPQEYEPGAFIPIKVDKATSAKTQLPYSFYHLPYCQPDTIKNEAENLGEILTGDLIQNSPFVIQMRVEETCKLLCEKTLTLEDVNRFKTAIDDEYMINILGDNLPVAGAFGQFNMSQQSTMLNQTIRTQADDSTGVFTVGLPVGVTLRNGLHILFNHWNFAFHYHIVPGKSDKAHIVGLSAAPQSIDRSKINIENGISCTGDDYLVLEDLLIGSEKELNGETKQESIQKRNRILFTYSVHFIPSSDEWHSRWNFYLFDAGGPVEIHWFSIANAIAIIFLLSGVIATILLQTLLRDIARYNRLDDLEDMQDDTGWKLVHGDVFRRPVHSKLLAVCAGTGIQLLGMCFFTLIGAGLGLVSPIHRGSLVQAVLLLYTFMGIPSGYVSARFNKLFEKDNLKRTFTVACMTAFLFPGVCFGIFFMLNIGLLWNQSSGAVNFSTMIILLLLWFGISVPLVFIGSSIGNKKASISLPVRTNQIPRQIPPKHWAFNYLIAHSFTGILPFCAVFTELLFIFSSVWHHQFYYLFGFLFLVVVILIVTCAETAIAFTYFQLCSEDYNWWWRSYWASASSAIYVFLYGIFYFYTRLNISRPASVLLYFGYTALMSYAFFLFTGAVGFISSFLFVRAIYGAVKID